MHTRYFSACILFVCLCTFISVHASDESSKHTESLVSHGLHEVIQKSQWVVMLMLTGLAGGMANSGKSNPWSVSGGMIVGMGMGIADELNHYLAGNNAYYLSSGVMGAATASNLPLPHYVNQLCGFVVGALAAGGYLNGLEKYGGALVSGAVNGAILGGMAGAGAGGVAGLADEVMSICDLTDNKPLSTALSGVTQLKILGPMVSSGLGHLPLIGQAYSEMVHQFTVPYLLESAGVVWAGFCLFTQGHNGVLSYLCTTMEPFQRESAHSDLELVQGMDASLAEIVDEDFIQKMSRIQALTIIGSQLLGSRLSKELSTRFQGIETSLAGFKTDDTHKLQGAFAAFTYSSAQLGLFCIPFFAQKMIDTLISSYYALLMGCKR